MGQLTVLITGGSGLVGRYLSSLLLSKGYRVTHLSRSGKNLHGITVYKWDPEKRMIDPNALKGTDYLVHLAGSDIGSKRWTGKIKDEIVKSRVDSARFLHQTVNESGIRLKAFITASAIGYYGSVTSDKIFTEDDHPGTDFLGNTCRLWEEAAGLFEKDGIRTVRIRTAVVLEKNDAALSKLIMPAKYGFVLRTGNGRQYMPWIHIIDLAGIYLKAIEVQNMHGVFNAVSPEHINHNDFILTMARVMHRPVFLPPVPAFILRAVLGEMSDVILKGSRVSSEKIINFGYEFLYPDTKKALDHILGNKYNRDKKNSK